MSRAALRPRPGLSDADPLATARPASLWRDTLGNIYRQPSSIVGSLILAALVIVAVFAPFIAPYDPDQQFLDATLGVRPYAPPCMHLAGCAAEVPEHLFGLDGNGRDILSRIIFGARVSLQVGLTAIGLAIVVGTLIGSVAGYLGGWVDVILMRLMDVVLAFPALLLAIAIVAALGGSLFNAMLAIGIVAVPQFARVVRASVLATKENDYVVASRALGESSMGILVRRVMPNSITPLIVQGSLGIGGAVLEIAALAFVGVVRINEPEWGTMIALAFNHLPSAPHSVLIPGLAVTFTVLGFNLLGDGLRDALDPRLNR